ncbi:MAG: hydroxyethylthiazole kinase [Bacillota bacterium]|nr:hydroxyethylthiazole kinase [Bacillota bacterium]
MNSITKSISEKIDELRNKVPLVHNITNYVTVNDVANALLAIGASPIMADDIEETADITAISSALVINIGTLNKRTIASMIASGKKANELGIPVIFDPVGAGASKLRNDATKEILNQVKVSVLRGNLSEVSFVAGLKVSTKGVDTSEEDEKNDGAAVAGSVAESLGCAVAITGAVDIISDGKRVVKISNGNKMLKKVTGTGCMTTALIGAFAGAEKDYFTAAASGVASMGIAGDIAFEKAGQMGTGSYHIAIIDALSTLDSKIVAERAKLHEE